MTNRNPTDRWSWVFSGWHLTMRLWTFLVISCRVVSVRRCRLRSRLIMCQSYLQHSRWHPAKMQIYLEPRRLSHIRV